MPSTPTFMTLLGEVRQLCAQPKTSHLGVYVRNPLSVLHA